MFNTRSHANSRSGSILVLTSALAIILLGMTALVTDVGYVYFKQNKLQTAVNAGWKAGYDKMMSIKSSGSPVLTLLQKEIITKHIGEVFKANGYTDAETADLVIEYADNNHISVKSDQKVGLFFARALNIDSANIVADRANHPDDSGGGMIPLAIPHGPTKDVSPKKYRFDPFTGNEEFQPGREYIIKLGEDELKSSGDIVPWGVVKSGEDENFGYTIGTEYVIKQSPATDPLTPGNFGCLDLDGNHGGGANDYLDRIKLGYEGTISIGDLIYPETGNMAGPTIDGVNYRLANGMVDIRIPVVSGFGNGQSSQVEILGFLNFKLMGSGIEGNGANAKASVRAIFTGLTDPVAGIPKKSFGRTDPDNISTNPTNYLDNFKYGFNGPIQLSDILLPEGGNASATTNEALIYRLNPNNPTKATTTVILPITDIAPEIGVNNPENLNARTIYDLDAKDNPNGVYSLRDYAFGSSVRIIGFAEFQLLAPEDFTRAGNNYDTGDTGDLGPYQPGQVRGKFLRYIIKPDVVP